MHLTNGLSGHLHPYATIVWIVAALVALCQVLEADGTDTYDIPFFTRSWVSGASSLRSSHTGDIGIYFTASKRFLITAFGRDAGDAAALQYNARVTLWDEDTQTAFVHVDVGPADPVENKYGWHYLSTPFEIASGKSYRMSFQATSAMSWYDQSLADASEAAANTEDVYADFLGAVNQNSYTYPIRDQLTYNDFRRPGVVNFKIAQGCSLPSGIAYADAQPCAGSINGTSLTFVEHGQVCVAQCITGYSPSYEYLSCDSGFLTPETFACSPSPCGNITGEHLLDPPCVEGYEMVSGSICTIRCESGYTASVESVNCSYGELSTNFSCIPNPCQVSQPEHGAGQPCTNGFTVESGQSCSTQCASGYFPSVAKLDCYIGKLTPLTFDCLPQPCTAPSSIPFALSQTCTEGASIASDSNCTTQCAQGYAPSIAALSCSLGSLTPSSFSCLPSPCAALSEIDNALSPSCAQGLSINPGSVCTTLCESGYTPSVPTLYCSYGVLSPNNFTCLPNPCQAPAGITNAMLPCLEGGTINSGSSCTTQCSGKYMPSISSLTCSAGVLSPSSFVCVPQKCTAPSGIVHAAQQVCSEGGVIDSGAVCTVQCESGYSASVATLSCSFGELAEANVTCDPSNCDVPSGIEFAAPQPCLEGSVLSSGTFCTLQCLPRHSPSSASLACSYGQLTPPNFTCIPFSCDAPLGVTHAASPACFEGDVISSGSNCTSNCETGFQASVEILSCSLGVLSPPNFTCLESPCIAPSGIPFADSLPCMEGSLVGSGDVCTAQCLDGYEASPALLTCLEGILSPSNFTCSPKACAAPNGIDNAAGCHEGAEVPSGGGCTTVCASGYTPTLPYIFCSLGNLTPPTFECIGNPCPIPSGVENSASNVCAESLDGSNSTPYISHGGRCTVQCADGYIPSAAILNCTAGQLSPDSLQCDPASCIPPHDMMHASLEPCAEGTPVRHGDLCTAQCQAGYVPSIAALNCSLGVLSPPRFECVGQPCPVHMNISLAPQPCGENISHIEHGENCTAQCQIGYTPSVASLQCTATQLEPMDFSCFPSDCAALMGIPHAAAHSCLEGSSTRHGGFCTPRCQDGFEPVEPSVLSCAYGQLFPETFSCSPLGCAAPMGILHSRDGCMEGAYIASGEQCTPQCGVGYTASVTALNCSRGVLTPSLFQCLGDECLVPDGVTNAASEPCAETNETFVQHGSTCSTQCASGYSPSVLTLDCRRGKLSPLSFGCWHCPETSSMVAPRYSGMGGVLSLADSVACHASPEEHWCHKRCGSLLISYSGHTGLIWVAKAFFSYATCAEFSLWTPGESLVRTDLLVTTLADVRKLHARVLEGSGFRGVVVLIDFDCGVAHEPPPSLRCWQPRTLLVGGDRFAGQFHYGAFLETPPGALSWLMRSGLQPEDSLLVSLRARSRPIDVSASKSKLLAYISDECSPEEELFFDLAVEALQGYGIIEALGRCHGSHPELIPSHCGGPCEAARRNPAEALKPFRFSLSFDASASSNSHCPMHVSHRAFDALIAGAIPVYRGPDAAFAVLDRSAIVHVPTHSSLQEGVTVLVRAALDEALTAKMMAAPALPLDASHRWFMWDAALRGERTMFSQDTHKLVAPLLRGAPHWRCAEHALLRTPVCTPDSEKAPGECIASGDLGMHA